MTREELVQQIHIKKSCLCIGLDTDIAKIPSFLLDTDDPVFEFNKVIIDHTHDYCVAYKPNIAFYESMGPKGWMALEKTLRYIPEHIFTIADAKRGDIGNTGKMYAKTYFEYYHFDAVTVAPYMGRDSIEPFLEYHNKWTILLGLTSNPGSADFQMLRTGDAYLYEEVMRLSSGWGTPRNLMYVTGATHAEKLKSLREIAPHHFFLVPGVGAQGGSVEEVMKAAGIKDETGLLINSSRDILYASAGEDFGQAAQRRAAELQSVLSRYI